MNPAQQILSRAASAFGPRFDAKTILSSPKGSPLGRLFLLDEIRAIRDAAMQDRWAANFYDAALRRLSVTWECPDQHRDRIPQKGPVVIVANHPYGLADGLLLGSVLSRVRADIKFLANPMLAGSAPEGAIIPVDPFEDKDGVRFNARSLRRALQWMADGGLLVIFPAGEVASLNLAVRQVREAGWKDTVVRLVRKSRATAVPIFVHGTNSPAFHLAGLVLPQLRTAMLPRELVNKQGRRIRISIGKPIAPGELDTEGDDSSALAYLQWRTNLLGRCRSAVRRNGISLRRSSPIGAAPEASRIQEEVNLIPADQILASQSHFDVYWANAVQIPEALREIGRLREIAFRAAGEGTGHNLDLDRFDGHYRHIFLWNRQESQIVGAYRAAFTDEVLPRLGAAGLYTNTLFRLKPDFFTVTGPAMELGRSFIRLECQKNFLPLLLLWKGVTALIASHPQNRILFGAVSISNLYRRESRSAMAGYLLRHHLHPQLARLVDPRGVWRRLPATFQNGECPTAEMDHLCDAIQEMEPDGKGLPVLLRQYLNLGGKAVGLHVDRSFANVLDALLVVDLPRAPRRSLDRLMGKAAAERYLTAVTDSKEAPR